MLDSTIKALQHTIYMNTIRQCDLCQEAHAPARTCEEAAYKRQVFQLITNR